MPSSSNAVTSIESSPRRVVMTVPSTPTQSPRSRWSNCLVDLGSQPLGVDEELELARPVVQCREGQAALTPDQHQPAGDPHPVLGAGVGGEALVRLPDVSQVVVGVEVERVRVRARRPHLLELVLPDLALGVVVLLGIDGLVNARLQTVLGGRRGLRLGALRIFRSGSPARIVVHHYRTLVPRAAPRGRSANTSAPEPVTGRRPAPGCRCACPGQVAVRAVRSRYSQSIAPPPVSKRRPRSARSLSRSATLSASSAMKR